MDFCHRGSGQKEKPLWYFKAFFSLRSLLHPFKTSKGLEKQEELRLDYSLTKQLRLYKIRFTAGGAFAESPYWKTGNPSNLIRVIPAQGGGALRTVPQPGAVFSFYRKEDPLSKMGEAQITIILNGQERVIASGTTIAGLLCDLSLPTTRVAIEHNAEILRKPSFDTLKLSSGDRLEIVTLVGGG